MVNIIEHEAKIAGLFDGARQRLARLDQPKPRRKLARAETGLVETLTPSCTAVRRQRL